MKRIFCLAIASIFISVFFIFLLPFNAQPQPISIMFTSFGCPAVLTTIEGKTYLLQLDLGSKFPLSLSKDILESINEKKHHGAAQWRDAKGNFYESPSYLIPSIKIGDLVLTDLVTRQENEAYRANTTLWNDNKEQKNFPNKQMGSLGRPLLEKTNILLDFQNSQMIPCNNKQQLQKMGFYLNRMVKVPFEQGEKGIIIINVETDTGILRLGLDTGATITLIRPSRVQDQKCTIDARGFCAFTTQKFSIGNNNFGSKNLFLYDFTPELLDIDGILGMDFLKNHIIYIDYKNKMIYVGDPKSSTNI